MTSKKNDFEASILLEKAPQLEEVPEKKNVSPEEAKLQQHLDFLRLVDKASYSDLFFRLTDSVLLLHPETYEIQAANDAAEKLFEISIEKLEGQRLMKWISPSFRESFEKTLRIIRRRYHPREFEIEFTLGELHIPARINGCVLKLNNGEEAIQFLMKDIRQERETQAKIKNYIAELENLNQRLEALSTTDEMTQLTNFRSFRQELQQEHSRAKRYGGSYSLVFFDVDHFKHYNDQNGHPAGDELLRELAAIMKTSCRETDMPSRYGGEEFVVLCPESNWQNALALAERIRGTVEKRRFKNGERQPLGRVSVSVGVASFPGDGNTPEEVLEAADQALYHSKKNGRNRSTAARVLKSGGKAVPDRR